MAGRALWAAVLIGLSAPASAGVFRCDDDGRVTYADRPCGSSVRAVAIAVPAQPVRAPALGLAEDHVADPPVVPGMSPRSVYQLMGRPTDLVVRLEGITPAEHWFYRTGEGTLTVTFRYGRVAEVVMR